MNLGARLCLGEAVQKVKMVYDEDYQNELSREVVAQHMGYQSLNGKSLGVLSALIKFGLLDGRGDKTRVSDLALQIVAHQTGEPERVKALREAANRPILFAEINEKFSGGKVSDQALRSYLLTRRFIPSAADAVIRAYRDTQTIVQAEGAFYDEPEDDKEAAMEHQRPHEGARVAPQHGHERSAPPRRGAPFRVAFEGDGIQVSGHLTTPAEVDRLVKILKLNRVLVTTVDEPLATEYSDDEDGRAAKEYDQHSENDDLL